MTVQKKKSYKYESSSQIISSETFKLKTFVQIYFACGNEIWYNSLFTV